jgi:hypothetical protein
VTLEKRRNEKQLSQDEDRSKENDGRNEGLAKRDGGLLRSCRKM